MRRIVQRIFRRVKIFFVDYIDSRIIIRIIISRDIQLVVTIM
jgi:hypothetical protein